MDATGSTRWQAPLLAGDRVTLRPSTVGRDEPRLDLALVENATGDVAGEVVLEANDGAGDTATLRIDLREPDVAGRGLLAEAAGLLRDHALRTMELTEITLRVPSRHTDARGCEAAGFLVTGRGVADGEEWVQLAARRSRLTPDYPVVTERLLLRPIDPRRDLRAMHGYRSREDVCRFVPFSPGPVEQLAQRLADPDRTRSSLDDEGQVLNLVAERRDTGEVIGDVVLFWHSATDGHAEVGYVIDPAQGGRGFATEAARAVLRLAFEQLGAHRVTAHIDARNTASVAVAERLGMRREATYVDAEWFKGEWSTAVVYAMLDREWRHPGNAAPA